MLQTVFPSIIRSSKLHIRKNRLKHVESLIEINNCENVASSWLYVSNRFFFIILATKNNLSLSLILIERKCVLYKVGNAIQNNAYMTRFQNLSGNDYIA